MTSKRIVPLLAVILIVVGILFAVFRSVSSPTPEECKQMDVLSGQLFVFDGVTNTIKLTQSFSAFGKQHDGPVFNPSNWRVGT